MGEKKHLLIRYVFRDSLHELIVDDVGAVAAPLRGESFDGVLEKLPLFRDLECFNLRALFVSLTFLPAFFTNRFAAHQL